jgi:hypothetical protein
MDIKWNSVYLLCSGCGTKLTKLELQVSSDGEMLLDFPCVKCGTKTSHPSSIANMVFNATKADADADAKGEVAPPTSSTVALAAPSPLSTPQWIKQEKRWERQFGPSWQRKGGSNR